MNNCNKVHYYFNPQISTICIFFIFIFCMCIVCFLYVRSFLWFNRHLIATQSKREHNSQRNGFESFFLLYGFLWFEEWEYNKKSKYERRGKESSAVNIGSIHCAHAPSNGFSNAKVFQKKIIFPYWMQQKSFIRCYLLFSSLFSFHCVIYCNYCCCCCYC